MTETTRSGERAGSARVQSPAVLIQHSLHAHPWLSPLAVLAISVVTFAILTPAFAQPRAISLLIQQTAVVAALGVGQTLIIITAGIDLSVGAVSILAMMTSSVLAQRGGAPAALAIALGVVIGLACGALNGLLVSTLNLPSFIVTLGTLSIFTAITLMLTGGMTIQATDLPAAMSAAGIPFSIGPFQLNVGVVAVAFIYLVVGYVLNWTAWGTRIYAIGDDIEAARLSGIRTRRVLISVYMVAGLIYGVASWVLLARAGAASPNGIADANLASITAVVIGGTSLFGGRGGIMGTVLGALIVQTFTIGLSLLGLGDEVRVLAVGILVIAAVSADQWIRKVRR